MDQSPGRTSGIGRPPAGAAALRRGAVGDAGHPSSDPETLGQTQATSTEIDPGFRSVLFDGPDVLADLGDPVLRDEIEDLNLDQIVNAITSGRDEYELAPFLLSSLPSVETIRYRHEVFADIEREDVFVVVSQFATQMRSMRANLAMVRKAHYARQAQRWFLDAVAAYCGAVRQLAEGLVAVEPGSRALRGASGYLGGYVSSGDFIALETEARRLEVELANVRYSLRVRGDRVTVTRYASAPDYSAEVLASFEKFRQEAPREYKFTFPTQLDMDHVEAAILELVARLHPDLFGAIERFAADHLDYLDPKVGRFDREIQFYVAYLERIAPIKGAGLSFCYPEVENGPRHLFASDAFDLALAIKLCSKHTPVVTNDVDLSGRERIIVVTGPNQGGKTTFARMVGQLHHLASLGCPVPGTALRVSSFDRLFTHFEREEDIETQRSKLEDDLVRIHAIVEGATDRSVVIMNESLASTTVSDALELGRQVLGMLIERGVVGVFVTFLDELAALDPAIVSMASMVDPADPSRRTYKVVRKPADGRAYAISIAEKYRLTYADVKNRIAT